MTPEDRSRGDLHPHPASEAGPVFLNPDLIFLDEIRHRPIRFTQAFLALNLVIFLVMEAVGSTSDIETIVAFGAKSNDAINQGQVWRFLTPVFIHIGIIHLAFNCYALWIVGQQVERLYGSARFVVFYAAMGAGGVVGSYVYNPGAVSAGASGAIFGLFGILLVFGVRNRRRVPGWLARAIGRGVLPVVVLNLVIGLAIPVVDNGAHVAGLISGMALGGLFRFQAPGEGPPPMFRFAQVLTLILIASSFVLVFVSNLAA